MPSFASSYHSGKGCLSREESVGSYFTSLVAAPKGPIPPINQLTASHTIISTIPTVAHPLRKLIASPLSRVSRSFPFSLLSPPNFFASPQCASVLEPNHPQPFRYSASIPASPCSVEILSSTAESSNIENTSPGRCHIPVPRLASHEAQTRTPCPNSRTPAGQIQFP